MRQEEILEYNRMCVNFLGWVYLSDFNYPQPIGFYDTEGVCRGMELRFHSDWNWLMPVIEKILDISNETEDWEWYDRIIECIPYTEDTAEMINKFLIFYNEQSRMH